jgi:TolB-like protein/DNA-binding winged helix-turn-helix (wHTH) protein/Tfp pilus assembly protein PilF
MRGPAGSSQAVRFDAFEADLKAGELHKHGIRIKLQDQPFEILAVLLERPGELVTREELRLKLWPAETFGDFDHGLNNAVNRLREALCDSADAPRFIETLPRRGYRFIAAVELVPSATSVVTAYSPSAHEPVTQPGPPRIAAGASGEAQRRMDLHKLWLAAGGLVALAAVLIGMNVQDWSQRLLTRSRLYPIKSIAVLPLENLTGDPSEDYFADGMTDALITDLAQISSLRVISRTSSIQYRHKPLRQISRELNVDVVVEGTVVRSGSRVRIDAQLIRADTDQHIWAHSYEGDLSQVLTLQNAVAEAISSEVRAKLTTEERARLASTRAVSPEAYELYLRGNYFLGTRTREGLEKALQYYQQATEKDPSSTLAFSGLANAYGLLASLGFLPEQQAIPKAKAAAEKAVSLDRSSPEALTALAGLICTDEGRFSRETGRASVICTDAAEAERLFRRANEINPGYALAHHWYARFLSANSRYDEALVEIRKARSLDPLSVRIVVNEGEILFLAGQLDQAREQLQLALDMNPNFPMTHRFLGRSLYYARQYDAALSHLRRAIELSPEFSHNNAGSHRWLGIVYETLRKYREAIGEFESRDVLNGMSPSEASGRAAALRNALSASGERGYWREWIALRMKDREKSPHAYAFEIAYNYGHLGDNAKAVAWLETCLQEKTCNLTFVRADPGLDALRSDTRYQSLLARNRVPQ